MVNLINKQFTEKFLLCPVNTMELDITVLLLANDPWTGCANRAACRKAGSCRRRDLSTTPTRTPKASGRRASTRTADKLTPKLLRSTDKQTRGVSQPKILNKKIKGLRHTSTTQGKMMGANGLVFLGCFVGVFATVLALQCYQCGQYNDGVGSITPCINETYMRLKDCPHKDHAYCIVSF